MVKYCMVEGNVIEDESQNLCENCLDQKKIEQDIETLGYNTWVERCDKEQENE